MSVSDVPTYDDLMWPTLSALKQLGGSASNQEMFDTVVDLGGFSDAQVSEPISDTNTTTKFKNRLAWARHHLKHIGAIESSRHAVWAITEAGREIPDEAETRRKVKEVRAAYNAARKAKAKEKQKLDKEEEEVVEVDAWKGELISRLLKVEPSAFERLSQRLLRECGFQSVKVTGKSNDGGIDGVGMYRMSLLTFRTLFQCKRYKGSVAPKEIRDFRGAMQGRAEKGLFITTGTFTREAKNEANRDGATPIELIDGDRLCDLLKEYGLGVSTKQRIEEDVTVEPDFFDDL